MLSHDGMEMWLACTHKNQQRNEGKVVVPIPSLLHVKS